MGKPLLSFGASSVLLFGSLQSVPAAALQGAPNQQPATPAISAPRQNDSERSLPGQFILPDGTLILLRFSRNVSSADAHVGDSIDFEVLEDVVVNGIVAIPKGSVAIGAVTEAQSKRRRGRAGNLEIVLDYVRLADASKVPIRGVKDAKGGSHVAGVTAGIIATGVLFFPLPVAPLFLLKHGDDITVPKGAALAAYAEGDIQLESSKFASATERKAWPESSSWLLQSAHFVGEVQEGFRKTCVTVSSNGDYHREERKQVPTGSRTQLEWAPPRVFEAKLTQADLDALRAILATPELHSMNGVIGDGGSLRDKLFFDGEGAVSPQSDIEIVSVVVARSNEPQRFEFADIRVARQQEPVSQLLDWLKGTDRLQQARLLPSQATNCSTEMALGSSSVAGEPMATGMTFPKAIFAPAPQLPHGTPKPRPVSVEILINPDGSVARASLESRPGPEVAQIVLNTVQKWRFQPAKLLGVPVADKAYLKVVEFQER